MTAPRLLPLIDSLPRASASRDDTLLAFLGAFEARNTKLYEAQEAALLALYQGDHVILNTPTGSGKSLVALGLHFLALHQDARSFYTCPIKALAHEKFFQMCEEFGRDNVGLLTGDASINHDAPIICCTQEILANLSLTEPARRARFRVIMDEFHYYGDPERGRWWQLPLLLLEKAQFLLMSATLGDCPLVEESLTTHGRRLEWIRSATRPVPLDYTYRETPLHETLAELVALQKAPIYVVNFTQAGAALEAQNATSQQLVDKQKRARIFEAVGTFRFDTPFGKDMRRFLSHGIGLHHAGILPKYRLLVEKLAQQGLLVAIMGTDTLGVGINVPIRTVLFTRLCKFDGTQTAILRVRDFRQIAGRAGRKGFDEAGSVVAQAPEHVIENKRLESRAGGDTKKLRKLVKKKPPEKNFVLWDEKTFTRLQEAPPEPLSSQFSIDYGLVLQVLRHDARGYSGLLKLIADCHERAAVKAAMKRTAAKLARSLVHAQVLEVRSREGSKHLLVSDTVGDDFSLHHALALFVLDSLPLVPKDDPDRALILLTLIESILENPHAVLNKQREHAKTQRMDELRQEGADYETRMAELEKVDYPKPHAEVLYDWFNRWCAAHPWLQDTHLRPKSIARDLCERCQTFSEYVKEYGLQRSEGVLLRYLASVVRALAQALPKSEMDAELEEVYLSLRTLVGQTDASLLAEWSSLEGEAETVARAGGPAAKVLLSPRAIRSRLRTETQRLTASLFRGDLEAAAHLLVPDSLTLDGAEGPVDAARLQSALGAFTELFGPLRFDGIARRSEFLQIHQKDDGDWHIEQVLWNGEEATDWALFLEAAQSGVSDLDVPCLKLVRIGA